jgi:hypothetical protein
VGGDLLDAEMVLLNNPPARGEGMVFLGIREEVVPLGMAQELLCLPDYARPELLFTLSVSQREQEAAAPRGTRALTVSFPMLTRDALTLKNSLEIISGIIPFLDRFIVHAEEHKGTPGVIPLPEKSLRKTAGTPECSAFYQSARSKNLYVIDDSPQSPYCVVSAARRFVERVQ